MNGRTVSRLLGLMLISTASASAMGQALEPLARYVPSDGLTVLVEHNGLDARADAWKGTAAYRMLNETSLGAMIEEIAAQLIDQASQGGPGAPVTGKEAVGLLTHLARRGFVVGYCGSLNPPQPRAVVVVIRDAARNPAFKKVVDAIPPLNEPAAQKVDAPGGRKVWQAASPPVRWWYEKDDAVFSFAPPGAPDPVVDVLEGKAPSALKDPARVALASGEPGEVPVGLMFVDLSALPPLPRQANELGLDAIKRVEGRLAILGPGLVTTLGINVPRPRKGILALIDQPPLGTSFRLDNPPIVTDFAVASIDPIKTGDVIMDLLRENSPESADALTDVLGQFQLRTGLSLRDDLLGKLGPRMAIFSPPGGGSGGMLGMWFTPPEMGLVAEVKDPKGFSTTLDRLMEVANRELKAAGAVVAPQADRPARPGTAFAEFRRLKGNLQGYVLAVPPSVLPTPAGLRPTIVLDPDRRLVALGTSPGSAREALNYLTLDRTGDRPARETNAMAIGQFDQTASLPPMLANLPGLVQLIGIVASQNRGPGAPLGGRPPFRLELDPDTIPSAQTLRPYLFPSKVTMKVNDASIRFSVYQAFPFPAPQFNSVMEAQVLIALLLPAVQAAREAARRAQCVSNMRQIGLGLLGHANQANALPSSNIVDPQGKPLLSWRVAILPYLDEKELFDKFKVDEPWDSPNNRALIPSMPRIFTCPSRPAESAIGRTNYQVFSGPGALFHPTRPTRIAEVRDGTSNTLMVVEAAEAVTWTKPDDLPFDMDPAFKVAPLFGAGSVHSGGFNALFADGSARFIKATIQPLILRSLITRNGGEIISADSF